MNRRLFILGLVLMAGCARFQPKPISPADSAAQLESRSLTNSTLKVFLEKNLHRELADWPNQPWDFEMLTLAAFYYHPSLDVARAQWHVAQAGIKTAGGRPNPTLTVTPGYNATLMSGVSPWFPAVNLDIPIETAGKRSKRMSAAEHLSESARLNIATATWTVRSNLRSSLYEAIAAGKRVMLLQRQVQLQRNILKLLQQKADVGAIANSELTPMRIALGKWQLDFADAKIHEAETAANIAAAIGLSIDGLEDLELSPALFEDFEKGADLTTADIRRIALISRTDILSALAEYAAAEDTLRLEIAKQYPDVHLNPGYQFDQGTDKWSVGITLDLPLLNRNQGPIAEAKARREESAARFNELQSKVLAEIDRTTATYRVSRENSKTLSSLADDVEKQTASMQAQYDSGGIERLEYMNATFELNNSELAQLDGHLKLQQSIGALEDAVQRPLTGDVFSAEKSPNEQENKK